jgi:hypothetical protein
VSIGDERDLYQRLDRTVEAITPRAAPVDGAMRRGRRIRLRRRAAIAAGVAMVVAAGIVAVPSLRHAASEGPAGARYTVRPPGPHSPPGLIATGTINGKSWQLVAGRPGTDGASPGYQSVQVSGSLFGRERPPRITPATLRPDRTAPVSFTQDGLPPFQVQFGAVGANVSHVAVRLGDGTVLTLHPARVYGVRAVAFAIPFGVEVTSATASSRQGVIATAIPFNEPGGPAYFGSWLGPGQHGLARASGRIGSGSYQGGAWSAAAYVGPWGACVQAKSAGPGESSCVDTTSVSALGTKVMFLTADTPSVAFGSAAASVTRIVVTAPDGKTTQVHPVTVGGAKFFAFPLGQGPKPWKWTAYDGSGGVVASSTVTPFS